MNFRALFWFLTLSLVAANAAPAAPTLPSKEKLKIYLLMGQSNMAGRAVPEVEDKTPHSRVLMFNLSNAWEVAVEPITRKEIGKTPGVGPGLAFGKAMAEHDTNIVIGLVPCAVGGTPLRRWVRGADLYSNTVVRAKAAAKHGELAGILWHQGEGDAGAATNAYSYGKRLTQMIRDIRQDLHAPNLPFVVGEIGEFNYDRPGNPLPFSREVNKVLRELPETVPNTACALSHGLDHKGDILHFSAKAQRELGRRYASEMIKLQATAKMRPSARPQPAQAQ